MATMVSGGADFLDAMSGGFPDQTTRDWLHQQSQAVYQSLGDTARTFFEKAQSAYQMINESQAMQMVRNLRQKNDNLYDTNRIVMLQELAALQTAGEYMQRWIMAEPTVRKAYLDQTCEGYGDSYVNVHGDVIGEDHYDYRRVMTGVLQEQGDEEDYVIKFFVDPMDGPNKELSSFEKIDILNTWDALKHLMEQGDEDPTSPTGNKL